MQAWSEGAAHRRASGAAYLVLSLAFLWPAIFYMKGVDGGFSVSNVGIGNFVSTWLLIIAGTIAGILGTAVSVYQTATG